MQTKGQKTRERILKISREIFIKNGFQNTSVSEIIAATGVKKGNLYYHFESKEALGLAVLNEVKIEFFKLITNSLVGSTPLEKVKCSIKAISEMMRQNNFVGGCLFGNTALEMSDINIEFSEIIEEVFFYWTELLEEQLRQAVKLGFLGNDVSTTHMAKLIVASIEGGIMMSRVSKDKKDFEECMSALNILIGM